ncbi:hypothetical protein H5410_053904 [Solanum commersonii]|uniref:Uncharacterized protein n=1 Tax=Solanum commersonii TaxID=4109 RepID=A0A9J5X748_SOLCO|nr:hypothetical protein H5410_053904 [Solanum commersonii]
MEQLLISMKKTIDYNVCIKGREIISDLSEEVGIATMIYAMLDDIDNSNEDVRNMTARIFSIVASTLGIPAMLPFLEEICYMKSWESRHNGVLIVNHITLLISSASLLPYVNSLMEIIEPRLKDDNLELRYLTGFTMYGLGKAVALWN